MGKWRPPGSKSSRDGSQRQSAHEYGRGRGESIQITAVPFPDIPGDEVLPLAEESDQASQELFSMNDVKVEVMRARGAGGQVGVSDSYPHSASVSDSQVVARKQNRICCAINPYTIRYNRFHAG